MKNNEGKVLKTEPKKTKNYFRDNIILVSAEQHVEMLENETDKRRLMKYVLVRIVQIQKSLILKLQRPKVWKYVQVHRKPNLN